MKTILFEIIYFYCIISILLQNKVLCNWIYCKLCFVLCVILVTIFRKYRFLTFHEKIWCSMSSTANSLQMCKGKDFVSVVSVGLNLVVDWNNHRIKPRRKIFIRGQISLPRINYFPSILSFFFSLIFASLGEDQSRWDFPLFLETPIVLFQSKCTVILIWKKIFYLFE